MKIKLPAQLLSSLLLVLSACQSPPSPVGLTVAVRRVVSGQTLEVLVPAEPAARVERVRLLGINAPDLRQNPWGNIAKHKLEELISDGQQQNLRLQSQSVLLESGDETKDRFGRRLAYVWHEGKLVNEQLVAGGYVLATQYWSGGKYRQRLTRAQEYARLMEYGIWNPEQPMNLTPREFRSQQNANR